MTSYNESEPDGTPVLVLDPPDAWTAERERAFSAPRPGAPPHRALPAHGGFQAPGIADLVPRRSFRASELWAAGAVGVEFRWRSGSLPSAPGTVVDRPEPQPPRVWRAGPARPPAPAAAPGAASRDAADREATRAAACRAGAGQPPPGEVALGRGDTDRGGERAGVGADQHVPAAPGWAAAVPEPLAHWLAPGRPRRRSRPGQPSSRPRGRRGPWWGQLPDRGRPGPPVLLLERRRAGRAAPWPPSPPWG